VDPTQAEEATEPTPRHPLWLRLAIVPLAAVLVAVLLMATGDKPAGKPVKTKHGSTTQGLAFELGVDDDGRPAAFKTTVVARCPSGRTVAMPWDSADGDGVRFRSDDDRLRVSERGELWELELDGRFDEQGTLRGSLRVLVRVKPKTKPAFDCVSKDVRFTARA
jgi:hypothetical protein